MKSAGEKLHKSYSNQQYLPITSQKKVFLDVNDVSYNAMVVLRMCKTFI